MHHPFDNLRAIRSQRLRRANRLLVARRKRGVTLIEVLIVVAIMAMISVGVGVVVIPIVEEARVDVTKTRAQLLRGVATQFVALGPGGCPTVSQLIEQDRLQPDNRLDGWDNPFEVMCGESRVSVRSNGKDEVADTADDIVVPVSVSIAGR